MAFAACGGAAKLGIGEKYYSGSKIEFKDSENIINPRSVRKKVAEQLIQKDSRNEIFSPRLLTITQNRLKRVLVDGGYLKAQVVCDSISKKDKAMIECEATLGKRYIIDSIFFIQDTLDITSVLDPMYDIKFTKSGDYYDVSNLLQDRKNFVLTANNNGFPFVTKEDVIFFVDTLAGDHQVDIHMQLRPTKDSLKYDRFRYGEIYVNPNFSLETDANTDTTDMLHLDEYNIVKGYNFLRQSALDKAIFLDKGKIYNRRKNKITRDRLLAFNLFKFVNIKTVVNEDRTIDHFLNLTPTSLESISGELELNNRQGNFLGVGGNVTYTNKNLFRGGERLDLSLSGGLETQFGDSLALINTSDLKLEAKLTIPELVMPFYTFRTNQNYIPKTYMSLSLNQQNRIDFYTVRAANAKYGFQWNETDYKTSNFSPIDLSWIVLAKTSPNFDTIINNDPRQAESFKTTLLLGSSYEYIYNKRNGINPVNQTYFKGTIESAGNLLSLLVKPSTPQDTAKVFGTPYSQYLRMTADFRKYWALNRGSVASRLVVGAGFAYGNSDELPYSKQYSIGGANSLRAFRLRNLGPGLTPPSVDASNQFIDQTGDIKIEANLEYRFTIFKILKGATFIDAGNVWLNESTTNQVGVFKFDSFANQIAVGTGLGLRLDINVTIIRLDLAFPIRDFRSDGKFGWSFDDINFQDKNWRDTKLVYNLGIGYPF